MNPLLEVRAQGQSIWYDYIQRGMIWTGALHRMIKEDGLLGVTSNPAIFEKAISGSRDYEAAVRAIVQSGSGTAQVFERVAVHDIQLAADTLRTVFEETKGRDGYVSLEVSPHLAHDTEGTVHEAFRLWGLVGRDNVMIKIPATPEGVPAIERVIAAGINVNVTLLFAVEAYERVAEAYQAGLEKWIARGGDPAKVASVASFFVSRIDSLVDKHIEQRLASNPDPTRKAKLEGLIGKVAIANAKMAYASYQRISATPRWRGLAEKGARPQRLLWASTGTKNPKYRDVIYVEELIGPDTVNTVPEATYNAFKDHGRVAPTLTQGHDDAQKVMRALAEVDISMRGVTDQLLQEGVVLFADAFDKLLSAVEKRREQLLGDKVPSMKVEGPGSDVAVKLEEMRKSGFVRRMFAKDARLWGSKDQKDPAVSGYLGWLGAPEAMLDEKKDLERLRRDAEKGAYETVVLLGMGGSSLAPDVFAKTFGRATGFPELKVLDSTVPAQVAQLEATVDPARSLFIVASKSGTTTEPLVFDRYFFDKVKDGKRFIAVTDPGSLLEDLARQRGFKWIFPGDPEIGGRYSAISNFGMVAAAAMGLDPMDLIARARRMAGSCSPAVPPAENPGVRLGTVIGTLAKAGRDKLTVLTTPGIASFGAWLEQLLAESTGKNGTGIIPVDGEKLGSPELYGSDRVFAYLRLARDAGTEAAKALDAGVAALRSAGHPVITIALNEPADLVQEMYRWEIATATAGHVLGINAFDQPNVQEAKDVTRTFLEAFKKDGKLPPVPGERKLLTENGVSVFADEANAKELESSAGGLAKLIGAHLGRAKAGDYVAFNAFLEMSAAVDGPLQAMRHHVRDGKKVATTLGYGPRFLHSTGQIHKGGPNSGVFVVITSDDAKDLPIPGEPFSFGVLKTAQANGDVVALGKRGRRVIRVHLPADVRGGLATLAAATGVR